MTSIPLRLGPLEAAGYRIQRSGLRWLCEDGHLCQAGEVVAFCNIGLAPVGRQRQATDPFYRERRDFQVAFAPRVAGRLRKSVASSRGGFLDQQHFHDLWAEDFAIGHLELAADQRSAAVETEAEANGGLRLLMLAGHRTTELAEARSGLLTGWHDRSRGWWGEDELEGGGEPGTLLSLGTCEQVGVIRGERFAFLELLASVRGPAQVAFTPDDVLVPCAVVVAQQFQRSPAAFEAIAADFARTFAAGPVTPGPEDCIFAGALLSALRRSPLADTPDILTRTGLRRAGPANAVVLSLGAESAAVLRHRRLGYIVNCHRFRLAEAGAATLAWLRGNFDLLKRTPDDIRRDYVALIDAVPERLNVTFVILNSMSTAGAEDIQSYAAFDRPIGETLATVRNKELNLMLHDLARERDVAILDADAIAAELGGAAHIPDGIHQSGRMQAEIRAELLRVLADRRVPGFGRTNSDQTISPQTISKLTSQGPSPSGEAGSGSSGVSLRSARG